MKREEIMERMSFVMHGERIVKYFENYPGEERITPKYEHDKLIGFYVGDHLTDLNTGEHFYTQIMDGDIYAQKDLDYVIKVQTKIRRQITKQLPNLSWQ